MVKKRPGVNARLTIRKPVYKPHLSVFLSPFLSRLKRHRPTAMRELPVVAEAGAAVSVSDLADDQLRGNDACGCALGEKELRRRQQRIEADAFSRLCRNAHDRLAVTCRPSLVNLVVRQQGAARLARGFGMILPELRHRCSLDCKAFLWRELCAALPRSDERQAPLDALPLSCLLEELPDGVPLRCNRLGNLLVR